jgi:nucleoside-diphosphate-sugar epimerase
LVTGATGLIGHGIASALLRRGDRVRVLVREIASQVLALAPQAGALPSAAPAWLLQLLAGPSAQLARWFGFKPLIAPGELSFLLWDASKAQRELRFAPTPAQRGLAQTVEWLSRQA